MDQPIHDGDYRISETMIYKTKNNPTVHNLSIRRHDLYSVEAAKEMTKILLWNRSNHSSYILMHGEQVDTLEAVVTDKDYICMLPSWCFRKNVIFSC